MATEQLPLYSNAVDPEAWLRELTTRFTLVSYRGPRTVQSTTVPVEDVRAFSAKLCDSLDGIVDAVDRMCSRQPFPEQGNSLVGTIWELGCLMLRTYRIAILQLEGKLHEHNREADAAYRDLATDLVSISRGKNRVLQEYSARLADTLRSMLVRWPAAELIVPNDLARIVRTVSLPWRAQLKAMWNLFWSAIRHPLSETTIDLSTGRVLYRT